MIRNFGRIEDADFESLLFPLDRGYEAMVKT